MEKGKTESKPQGEKDNSFYSVSAQYWAGIEPTVDGVLGGLGNLSQSDINSSEKFLKSLFQLPNPPGSTYALDCGAGIGRITKNLLVRHFDKVDLVDQDSKFIEEAKKNLEGVEKVGEFYCSGLQSFTPAPGKYDIIWIQWVLLHMTDDDTVGFLVKCKTALKPNGMLFIKENTTRQNVLDKDDSDGSLTRSFSMFNGLFTKAGYKVVSRSKQKGFPKELYPVWSFALAPVSE